MHVLRACLFEVIVVLVGCSSVATAQECGDELPCDSIDVQIESFFPETSNHPGLLGKAYFDLRYHHNTHSGPDWMQTLDESFQGIVMTASQPIPALDQLLGPVRFDLFTSFRLATLKGKGELGPRYVNGTYDLDQRESDLGIALTGYVDIVEGLRPFVQFGYKYGREERVLVRDQQDVFGYSDSQGGFLLNVGLEADLASRLAARVAIDVDTVNDVDRSRVNAELIFWPLRRVFIRGGVLTYLHGENVGGQIGGGFVF